MIYTPEQFVESDHETLLRLIRTNSFATLICATGTDPLVTHVPALLNRAGDALQCHVARANPIWHDFTSDRELLFIFHGPHCYISPNWYTAKQPSVPTWNYAVVHVHGIPEVIEDRERVEAMLTELVTEHESSFEAPWSMDLPAGFQRRMIDGIVAFEARITRMEGKFKLSQNRPLADRRSVIDALRKTGNENAAHVAALMQEKGRR
jgi:transcriptional regulator